MRALWAGAAVSFLLMWFAAWLDLMNRVTVFLSPELLESRNYVSLQIHVSFYPCGCRARFENGMQGDGLGMNRFSILFTGTGKLLIPDPPPEFIRAAHSTAT